MSKKQTAEYWREYRRKNVEKKRAIEKLSRERDEYKAHRKEYMRKWREEDYKKNPHKWLARSRVHDALRAGKITRQPCEVCGAKKSEAHHEDHYKPLEIMWLCRVHHMQRDLMKL